MEHASRTTTPAFSLLPRPDTSDGAPRRVGVEVEFAGLDLSQTAHMIVTTLGGTVSHTEDHALSVTNTSLGDITVELDTALTKLGEGVAVDAILDVARQVVPVEIVTEPLAPDALPNLDTLMSALRRAGARGSRDGLVYGFGVHLNVEIAGRDDAFVGETVRAYGLLEHILRADMQIDNTRRVLPFVQPWPDRLVADLLAEGVLDLAKLMTIYARHTQSRNHGLDLLPLLKWAAAEPFDRHFPGVKSAARPAFHFRLPESRIDEPDWSLAQAWAQWLQVERLADDPTLVRAMAEARRRSDRTKALRAVLETRGNDDV